MKYFNKYQELKKEDHIFSYSGSMNFHDVVFWKESVERILLLQNAGVKQRKRVVNILIEGLQNIQIHGRHESNDENADTKECLLVLGRRNGAFSIAFGNFISNRDGIILNEKLKRLEDLSLEEIKQHYMQMLEVGAITHKGGASLGLVKMFLDSNKQYVYEIQQIDDNWSFFTLEFRVVSK